LLLPAQFESPGIHLLLSPSWCRDSLWFMVDRFGWMPRPLLLRYFQGARRTSSYHFSFAHYCGLAYLSSNFVDQPLAASAQFFDFFESLGGLGCSGRPSRAVDCML